MLRKLGNSAGAGVNAMCDSKSQIIILCDEVEVEDLDV